MEVIPDGSTKHVSKNLIIEPFYGGSHRQLVDLLVSVVPDCAIYTLPAKKWHWRARTSALYFANAIPELNSFRCLFCSCVLNLAELLALRIDLQSLRKIIYFHENQLVYPTRKKQDRDFQYGYNQILSCLVADEILFNSRFNMDSFLSNISTFFNTMPDHRPKNLADRIRPKCRVLYFPLDFTRLFCTISPTNSLTDVDLHVSVLEDTDADADVSDVNAHAPVTKPVHIVWPHRWEHDKNPEQFFETVLKLVDAGLTFRLSVLGQTYTDVPSCFEEARCSLKSFILHWGYVEKKSDYLQILRDADVVVSTADHEFFGVSMLEAAQLGCYPLCPNRLVYPEIFPASCLYNTNEQLLKRLREFCKKPWLARHKKLEIDFTKYSWDSIQPSYLELFSFADNLK